jgi:hypothetical protein
VMSQRRLLTHAFTIWIHPRVVLKFFLSSPWH